MLESEGPEPAGFRLGPGPQARRHAGRPLRAGGQEETEAAQVVARSHRWRGRPGEDGQPAARRPRTGPQTPGEVSRPRVVIPGAGFGGLTCPRAWKRPPLALPLVDRTH